MQTKVYKVKRIIIKQCVQDNYADRIRGIDWHNTKTEIGRTTYTKVYTTKRNTQRYQSLPAAKISTK